MSKPDKHMKKGPYEREMARRRRERKRRIRRFHLICLGVMLLAFIIVCVNIFSHKKSIRKEAVSLYEAGNYQEALDKFKEAYAEKQWFSDSINVDILLYEADCMMQLQLFSDAELTYLDIQKKYPTSKYDKEQLSYLSDLSHALGNYQRGDYVSTVATFTKAVENGHKDISIYAAICYENQKSYDKMKEYLAEKRQTLSEAMHRENPQETVTICRKSYMQRSCAIKSYKTIPKHFHVPLPILPNIRKIRRDRIYTPIWIPV